MRAVRTQNRTYDLDAATVFDTLLAIVQQAPKRELIGLSNETLELRFVRGMSAMQWGQLHLAEVVAEGTGARVSITCGGRNDAPTALLDGFQNGRAAGKVLKELDAALAATPRPASAPVGSFALDAEGNAGPWVPFGD